MLSITLYQISCLKETTAQVTSNELCIRKFLRISFAEGYVLSRGGGYLLSNRELNRKQITN